ncbi:hypothetical protein ACVW0K_000809 [Streptomyces filamentosus]
MRAGVGGGAGVVGAGRAGGRVAAGAAVLGAGVGVGVGVGAGAGVVTGGAAAGRRGSGRSGSVSTSAPRTATAATPAAPALRAGDQKGAACPARARRGPGPGPGPGSGEGDGHGREAGVGAARAGGTGVRTGDGALVRTGDRALVRAGSRDRAGVRGRPAVLRRGGGLLGPAHGVGRRQGGGAGGEEAGGRGDQAEADEEALHGGEAAAACAAGRARAAVAQVAGYPLAPQRGGVAVPGAEDPGEAGAARIGVEGADDGPAGLQAFPHPLDADGGVGGGEAEGLGEFGAGELARGLQPPQGEQLVVVLVEPAGGAGDVAALPGQAEAEDREVGEVARRVGELGGPVEAGHGGLPALPPAAADAVHGDGDEPGPEAGRVPQSGQPVEGADQGLLDDVVGVGVPVEGAPHHVVDERQAGTDQFVPGVRVAGARRFHQGGGALLVAVHGWCSLCPRSESPC